ncbi:hypothetical protein FF38_00518 [Lucilia cuprina]|uniref:Lipase domain-containing protein n=1 Tax=Lucilia cuprina TaxID=7375 RepID=A0A0L0CQA7_LUCCU|nr:hypothetical protein FF38_00518 [Lucilia cuprina]
MKYFLVLLLFALTVTSDNVSEKKRVNGVNGWFVPVHETFDWVDMKNVDSYLSNATMEWVDMNDTESYLESVERRNIFLPQNDVFFHLYTPKNLVHSQLITMDKKSIDESNFNAAYPTRISVHGFLSGPEGYINYGIRDAWLFTGNYNYIFVEWNAARYSNYALVVLSLRHVAFVLGNFLEFMSQNNYFKFEELVMNGHSLGAHIVGLSARSFHNIKTIVGLDPASPLIRNDCEFRLCARDAKYVESIHTNAGNLGYLTPIGRGSFYPNGGQSQPACPWYHFGVGICEHSMSIKYYAEAIQLNDFPSIKCNTYSDALRRRCGSVYSDVRMGGMGNTDNIDGVYYVPVNGKAPYGSVAGPIPIGQPIHFDSVNMKYFLLISLIAAVFAVSNVIPEDERIHGENGWYIPNIYQFNEWVDKENVEAVIENSKDPQISNNVTFFLYTRKNPSTPQIIIITNESISNSNFNVRHQTRVCVHGWMSDKDANINTDVRDAWLSKGEYNYIFVQWDSAKSPYYPYSAKYTFVVGGKISTLLHFLIKHFRVKLQELTIIGHSLGAHISGFTAKHFRSTKVNTVIGLDPALPLFDINQPDKRLSNTDADYVQSIHTNGGRFGFLQPIGKGAFYPNGGESQPACWYDITGVCDHSMAIYYYAEAVKLNDFNSMRCLKYEQAKAKSCPPRFSNIFMGALNETSREGGIFFVPVHKDSPYGVLC